MLDLVGSLLAVGLSSGVDTIVSLSGGDAVGCCGIEKIPISVIEKTNAVNIDISIFSAMEINYILSLIFTRRQDIIRITFYKRKSTFFEVRIEL